jgi:glycosyltransferase involved in cell wall biosynthesis
MRIARVLTRLNLGGPARQVLASDPLLVQRGHALCVFAGEPEPGEGDLGEELCARGIDLVRLAGLRRGIAPARDIMVRRRLRLGLAAFRPDVVHTHASKAGTLGRLAARGLPDARRIARVHTFHGHVLEGYFPPWIGALLRRHEASLARETDRIVAVSHATAEDLLRLGVAREDALVVVPPGIELDPLLAIAPLDAVGRHSGALRGPLGLSEGALVAGVVGRLAPVKRPELALAVFALLAERHPALELVFLGDGAERAPLEARIRALPGALARRVHLFGARSGMDALLADLDLVLLTSRSEGLPVALIEAAAAALPVVATDVGGVGELVAHERTGFLGKSADELAFGLDRLIGAPLERAAMGRRARLRVAGRHSAVALAERLEALYLAVLAERRGGSAEEGARL